jgi:hypothetical protein
MSDVFGAVTLGHVFALPRGAQGGIERSCTTPNPRSHGGAGPCRRFATCWGRGFRGGAGSVWVGRRSGRWVSSCNGAASQDRAG